MGRIRRWTDEELKLAVSQSRSVRSVLKKLNLIPAGGNYAQIRNRIKDLKIDDSHFTGKGWNVGWGFDPRRPSKTIEEHLTEGSRIQSYKLKKYLFNAGLKMPKCELCGWAEVSVDGRIPVELDHINGVHIDNRLDNLRVLCPNCHSLQPTHRGKNKKVRYARVL